MKINCLEPKIFNKIAAGEVVERPASIVKELVENSIDAGASEITIEIENGGITKIRVTDNGSGIDYDDLERAFLPHATSKIKDVDDLFEIKTLGFRGEALASIGAVSFVKVNSKTKDASSGGEIQIEGGEIGKPTFCGCSNGTDIIVQNLFYNVPARAKFLKKPKTEEGEVTDLVEKFILANPCVSIKYIIDGKIRHFSNGKGLVDAIYEVYGKHTLDNLLYFEQEYDNMRIYGYTSKPEFTKPNKTYQTIIINNRYIKNALISSAVTNAYGEVLMKKQFPFFVIYFDMDFKMVDVNVHPNKMEVRFENGNGIYARVFELVNKSINSIDFTRKYIGDNEVTCVAETPIPEFSSEVIVERQQHQECVNTQNKGQQTANYTNANIISKINELWEEECKPEESEIKNNLLDTKLEVADTTKSSRVSADYNTAFTDANIFSALSMTAEDDSLRSGVSFGSRLLNQMQTEQQKIDENIAGDTMRILGVLFRTYIVIEYKNSMFLIDQHAGHERVLFDKLMEALNNKTLAIQPLLVPQMIEVNAIEKNYVLEHIDEIRSLGFDIDEFGENTFKVSTVPYILEDIDFRGFFDELLSDMKNPKAFTFSGTMRDKIASMACKAAVKAGDTLSAGEVNKLIEAFAINKTKLLCPHGRPIVIEVTEKEIEKWFKRIV